MVVLLLLYCCCLPYVWTHHDVVSNSSVGSPVNSSRAYKYYHEALTSGESNATINDFGWRIWGGDYIPITQAPYAVLYGWTCSGTLIAPNWVVTAAHCHIHYSVHVGAEYSSNTIEYAVIRHVFHPGWFYPKIHYLDFDCLLVQLAGFIPETAYTRPIAFGSYEDLYVGQIVTISGWGHSTYQYNIMRENSVRSDRLKAVKMTVIDYNYCATNAIQFQAAKFGEFADITPRMVCAEGNFGGATCFGDSGAPVVANNRLVGIVSWGIHCEPLLVFTNLVMLKGWISEVTGLILSDLIQFGWRIWDGHFISIVQAPYTVLYGWYCGGTLIATNWVLTVDHCDEEFSIHAGSEFQISTNEYAVKRHVYHPNWSDESKEHYYDYDMLLLELEESVPETDYTRPIALGGPGDMNPGQLVSISGWGGSTYKFNISSDDSTMSGMLSMVEMTVLEHNDCATRAVPFYGSKYGDNDTITPRMDYAESKDGSVCFGDSGAPVVANNNLVGVVSWSVHCEPLLIFSNVVMAKDWISSTTGIKV